MLEAVEAPQALQDAQGSLLGSGEGNTTLSASPRAAVLPESRNDRPGELERFAWLDPWLIPAGAALGEFVRDTVAAIERFEQQHRPRKRARKQGLGATDRQRFVERVSAVVTSLAHAVHFPPQGGRLAVMLRHGDRGGSRYEHPSFGKRLADELRHMDEMGLLDLRTGRPSRGQIRGVASSIAPSDSFAEMLAAYGVRPNDFGRDEREEVILLTKNERTLGEPDAVTGRSTRRLKRERIEYADTAETIRMRAEVERFNSFLAKADIELLPAEGATLVDISQRRLRRHFTFLEGDDREAPRFDQGGRLFGGFWQAMRREDRSRLRIRGEPVAVLDYSSMFTRLAYAVAGAEPPVGDLYALPGLEAYRADVKLFMNALWFDRAGRRVWPRDMLEAAETVELFTGPPYPVGRLPHEIEKPAELRKRVATYHAGVAHVLCTGLGHRLMAIESSVMVRVLTELMEAGVVGLGLHDGLMVPASSTTTTREIMEAVVLEEVGVVVPVAEQTR